MAQSLVWMFILVGHICNTSNIHYPFLSNSSLETKRRDFADKKRQNREEITASWKSRDHKELSQKIFSGRS